MNQIISQNQIYVEQFYQKIFDIDNVQIEMILSKPRDAPSAINKSSSQLYAMSYADAKILFQMIEKMNGHTGIWKDPYKKCINNIHR